MSIGSTIKRLRREKDITQEQLAEYLGITSRAISQWECDRTSPDISQIPALCHIFDVTSDTLLGIDIEKSNEAINDYIDKANSYTWRGDFKSSLEVLREAHRKFPRSYSIMTLLADSILFGNCDKGNKDYDEVITLCNRVLAECTDSIRRYEALQTLGIVYDEAGKREELLKIANEMPNIYFCREDFMRYRWRGEADFEYLRAYMDYLHGRLVETLGIAAAQRNDQNGYIYSTEDRIYIYKTEVSLLDLFFPDGDYQFKAQFGAKACRNLCKIYLENRDNEEAWRWVEREADFTIHMDTYDFDKPHTSPIFCRIIDGGWVADKQGNHAQRMLNWLTTADECAVLRSDARYEALVNRLKVVAKKLK